MKIKKLAVLGSIMIFGLFSSGTAFSYDCDACAGRHREYRIKEMPEKIIGVTKIKNQEELKSFYNLADVFLNLSLEETMGLVTVEAMACGTPAVVFNSTACPELLAPQTGEILYEQGVEYIMDVLKGVYEKGKIFYSTNCREHAVRNFSLQRMQQEYYNYYREIEGKV